jgi:hypothetical protein
VRWVNWCHRRYLEQVDMTLTDADPVLPTTHTHTHTHIHTHTHSYRDRPEGAISTTLRTLRRLFLQLPLEPYEEAALARPFSTTEELRGFLRRHYFDMIDLGLETQAQGGEGQGEGKGAEAEAAGLSKVMAMDVEEALAELWLFALIDRPDALEWVARWKRHLDEVDGAAAEEVDRMVADWELIAARALGAVEMGRKRERVVGEMMAWAQRVKGMRRDTQGVGAGVGVVDTLGVQAALDAAEGGPGGVDSLEQMVEAVGEMQEERGSTRGKGFGRPNGNGAAPGPEEKGRRGSKRRYRRPWARGPNGGDENGGGL